MMASVVLTVLTGPHKGDHYRLHNSGEAMLGRSPQCDISVCGGGRDLEISRRHCRLTVDGPAMFVEDLGSLNGTYVNGHPCPKPPNGEPSSNRPVPVSVKDGDILTIGGTSIEIRVVEDAVIEEGANNQCPCLAKC